MRRASLLLPLSIVAIVCGIGLIHSKFIGNYAFLGMPRFGWLCGFMLLLWASAYVVGLPQLDGDSSTILLRSTTAVAGAGIGISLLTLIARTPLLPLFDIFGSAALLVPMFFALTLIAGRGRSGGSGFARVLAVVGYEERELLASDLETSPERHALLLAALTPAQARASEASPSPLLELAASCHPTVLVLDRKAQLDESVVAQAAALHQRGVRIRTLSLFYDEWLGKIPLTELEHLSLLFDINEIHRQVYARVERWLDIVLALIGLAVMLVLAPVVALANLAGNRGPLLYRQQRVGKSGTVFTMLKFRTMPPGAAGTDWTIENDPRLSTVGRMLRRTHLDELPQAINVLRRDLSVVGPRPEQPHYVEQLTEKIPYYAYRHLVRPGITGWAQVKCPYGADELGALEKLQYEFFYLRHQSLSLDLRILGRTLRSIVNRDGR